MLTQRVIILLYLTISQMKPCVANSDQCLTPNSIDGRCINLQECPSVYAMANNFNAPITIEALTFLMRSQCGFNGTNPKVCCPQNETVAPDKNNLQ
ncbi:unnamed protein product [Tenebrio molitor]|nr:unnamed protein product [Tenebrio molitor]